MFRVSATALQLDGGKLPISLDNRGLNRYTLLAKVTGYYKIDGKRLEKRGERLILLLSSVSFFFCFSRALV